ncbi:MAG TPA: hypothetical protein VNJ03_05015 [Vicinamibacterales bacterium]|nr:hypothetical protein [Vicinamibacterales bacterium]
MLFAVSLPAVTARLYSSDEVQYFSYLRSLWFDRDVSFENEYRYFYDHDIAQSPGYHETFLERRTETGLRFNYGTIGCALLWSPFYGAADLWTRATGGAEPNGFSTPYIRAVAYGSAFYAFLAVLLSIRAARSVVGERGPFAAGCAVWLGTPLLFYMYVAPPFSHACSAFGVAVFVSVWLQVRRTWSARGAFALGLCAALLAMIREQDVFVALGPAVDFTWSALGTTGAGSWTSGVRSGTKRVRRVTSGVGVALSGIAGVVIGYLPQLAAYNSLNGYPGPASHVARKMFWHAPHALQVLFSPAHGFFFWTPLALLAIAGLALMRTRVATCLLIMSASQVYVAGSVASWTVAGAFGQRRFVGLTIILVIGLAALWNAAITARDHSQTAYGARSYVLSALVILTVWWNIALMAQFATGQMDRQRLEPARNVYNAFVTLPLQTPSLIYRYLMERESFYRSTPAKDAR